MTTFADDFNRADSSSLGAGWVEVSGDWSIISNQLSTGTTGGTILLRAATAMATSDNFAQVTIAATTAVSQGVWCRGNSDLTSGYALRNNGSNWALFSVTGGTFTSIGTYSAAAAPGDVAKVQAVGSTITAYINGISRISVTNAAVTTGTTVGIRAEANTALRFDDFTGADVTSGATGDAALSNTATLSASGLRATAGGAALASTAGLAASGVRATQTDAATTATATLTAAGQAAAVSDTALAATAALSATGQRGATTGAGLTAAAALTAQGQGAYGSSATLTAAAELAADGTTGTQPGGAALGATATLAAAGTTPATSNAMLTATATLTASGTTISTRDDIDVTVSAPYSRWAVGEPRSTPWLTGAPY